jgi:hypothetical protein
MNRPTIMCSLMSMMVMMRSITREGRHDGKMLNSNSIRRKDAKN